jgi:hypothetical protein
LGADNTVLALTDDDRLQSVPVQLLRRSGDQILLAPDGIENREVVRERSPLLGAGIKINPIRSTPPQTGAETDAANTAAPHPPIGG